MKPFEIQPPYGWQVSFPYQLIFLAVPLCVCVGETFPFFSYLETNSMAVGVSSLAMILVYYTCNRLPSVNLS